jgi:hypothetical protein
MSEEKKDKKPKEVTPAPAPTSVAELVSRCPVCKGKTHRAGFCNEHFMWFKEGLVNRKGEKPKDFDKKYQNFLRKQAA